MDQEYESSDSSDEENDEQVVEAIKNFKMKLLDAPLDYQTYLDFVEFTRTHGEYDELRYAREQMSKKFPLSPKLWLDWISDEKSVGGGDQASVERIWELFERAICDYSSVDVWIEYTQFAMSLMSSENGIEKVRSIINRGLADVGLHTAKGSLLWDLLLLFEKSVLGLLSDEEQVKSQIRRIFDAYKRQLSVPLQNMESTFQEFEEFTEQYSFNEEDINSVKVVFEKTRSELEKLIPFEDAILISPNPHTEQYKKYIEFSESNLSPAAIHCLYERAITDNLLDIEIWTKYLHFTEKKLRVQDVSFKAHERSIRNCYWSGSLWSSYLESFERFNVNTDQVIDVFEKGLRAGLATGSDFYQLWLTYLCYLRRRTNFDIEKEVDTLRKTFTAAADHLATIEGADPEFSILQYSARVEAVFCRNITNAREIFENMLEVRDLKCKSSIWLEYFNLEYAYGDRKTARKILTRALYASLDWPESIGQLLLKMEREEGDSFDSYEKVLSKYEQVMKKVNEKKQQQQETTSSMVDSSSTKQPSSRKRKADVETSISNETQSTTGQKSNQTPSNKKPKESRETTDATSTPHYVRPKDKQADGDDLLTVFVSNLDFKIDDEQLRNKFSTFGEIVDIRLVRNYKGLSKGFGYVQFTTMEGVHRALAADRFKIDGRPCFISEVGRKKEFQFKSGPEDHKLFIGSLAPDIDEQYLRPIFEKYGQLKDIRIVTYRNGHSKGCAYVEYEDEVSARNGLNADGMLLKGKNIKVAISDPSKKGSNKQQNQSKSLGSGVTESGSRGQGGRQRISVPLIPTIVRRQQLMTSQKNGSINDDNNVHPPQ